MVVNHHQVPNHKLIVIKSESRLVSVFRTCDANCFSSIIPKFLHPFDVCWEVSHAFPCSKKTNYVQCISHVFIPIGSSYSWKKRWNLHSGRSSCRITTKVTRNCNVRFFSEKKHVFNYKSGYWFLTTLCGVLVFNSVSRVAPASRLPPPASFRLSHTISHIQ